MMYHASVVRADYIQKLEIVATADGPPPLLPSRPSEESLTQDAKSNNADDEAMLCYR
jgi:hypothetical protein